jgi:hypothetical protein
MQLCGTVEKLALIIYEDYNTREEYTIGTVTPICYTDPELALNMWLHNYWGLAKHTS